MDGKLAEAEAKLVAALGRQSQFWGLGRIAGEIYAILYLSVEPVALEEIAQRLQVTKGNISLAVRPLEQLGMLRRSWRQGDRRVFFEAERDFWKIAHSVVALRHKPEFDHSFALVDSCARLVEAAEPSGDKKLFQERLIALQDFYRMLDDVAGAVLALGPGQLKAVVQMLRLAGIKRKRSRPRSGQSMARK